MRFKATCQYPRYWHGKLLVMTKLTVFFILLATLQSYSKGYTQGLINLREKATPLKKIFTKIEQQTGYTFVYRDSWMRDAKPVDITVTNAGLEEVLQICLQNQALTYDIVEKTIIISQKAPSKPHATISTVVDKKQIDVKGRVVNEKGEPAAGVTVQVKGTKTATSTDVNGDFYLTTVDEDAVLVFTSVNMETFEVNVNGKAELLVNLKTKVTALGDVTVTVNTGYQQIPKERATGSFEFVSNEELNRRVGPDILSRLEGVTTGMQFDRRTSSPNQIGIDQNGILIRGLSTLTGSMKQPLIVLNNFPYEGNINNINPNDIESVTILKDAAAASIYGARAANGVIVLTTKQGLNNKAPQVSINTNFNFIQQPDLFKYQRMSTGEFIDVESFLFKNGFYNGDLNNNSTYPALSPVIEILAKRRANIISAEDSSNHIGALTKNDVRDDFNKYIYRKALHQQYSLNISGGNQFIKYVISGGLDRSPNVLVGNNTRRITFFSNNSIDPIKNLNIVFGINYNSTFSETNSLGNIGATAYDYSGSRTLYPYARLADQAANALSTVKDYRSGYIDTAGGGKLLSWTYKPLDELANADKTFKQQEILINIGATLRISKSLQLQNQYQFQRSNGNARDYYSEQTYFARNLVNLYTQIQGSSVTRIIPNSGILDMSYLDLSSHTGRTQLSLNKVFENRHEITSLLGVEIRERISTSNRDRTYGYSDNYLSSAPIDYLTNYRLYGNRGSSKVPYVKNFSKTTDHFVSLYGNFAYTFDKRYTVSASVRRDASNLFGVDINNKWQPFWTVGAAWNVHNETFFKSGLFPLLRVRGSYGYQGNVNNTIAPYTILNYNPTNSSLNNMPFANIGVPANPGLSWETLRQLNLALDFRLKGNCLSGTVDIFFKKSENLLLGAMNDPTSGINSITKNSASLSGNGLELALNSINISGKNFKWATEFGLSIIKNELIDYKLDDKGFVAEFYGKNSGLFISPIKGKSPYSLFSFPFGGLDAQGNPQGFDGKQVSTDYQRIFNQRYDTANLTYHGSSIPTTFGFLNNTFSYKGFALTVGINYNFGYFFKKSTINYYRLFMTGVGHADYSKRWQVAGDETRTTIPSMVYPASNSRRDDFYANSSVNVLKGDNVRMQFVKASYNVKSMLKKMPFISMQIYATVSNIGILWRANKEGLDPDIDSGNAPYPIPRHAAFGINVIF
jgi:TonB-dependent starch-binding outer membrane protein SusC